jgi:hypothetical protein
MEKTSGMAMHHCGGSCAVGPGHLRAQGQAGPDHAPGACHLTSDLLHQRVVLRARGTVALQRLGQQPDAGVGHAQGLVPAGRAHTLQQPGGE